MEELTQLLTNALEKAQGVQAQLAETAAAKEKLEVTNANLSHMCRIFYDHELSKDEKKALSQQFKNVKTVAESDAKFEEINAKLSTNRLTIAE